jgi:hypothetical protein
MATRFWPEALLCLLLLPSLRPGAQDLRAYPLSPSSSTGFFVETDQVRAKLKEAFYVPAAEAGRIEQGVFVQAGLPARVQFKLERQGGYLYYLFLTERDGAFPVAGRGNYIIKKDPANGQFLQVKVFLRDDEGCYVRLFPLGQRSSMDVYLFGVPVYRRVILPHPLAFFLTEPFARVMALSSPTVQWERLLYEREEPVDRLVAADIESIRRALPGLGEHEDGAMDETGAFVYITTGLPQEGATGLNCSGFAKWVTDGFYRPLTGAYLSVQELKAKHLELRGNRWSRRFEAERDPYFGLDWSRNLAMSLHQALGLPAQGSQGSSPEDAGLEAWDVRQAEFLRYTEDVGYALPDVELLLFLDSADNPGNFYIGSLNEEYGRDPVLRQHFHLVVLFPHFAPGGAFRVAVFESSGETSLSALAGRFRGAFMHLVRLPVCEVFRPPPKSR